MKTRSIGTIAGLALLAFGTASANASPVEMTYSVTGSSGAWDLDLTVTNNIGGTNNIYFLGIRDTNGSIPTNGSPPNWFSNEADWNNGALGGSGITYDLLWASNDQETYVIAPGESLSGFEILDTSASAPSTLDFFAFAFQGDYSGPGCFHCAANPDGTNPGFEGVATLITTTPVPAALPLFGTGLGALGLFGWRRKRKNAAALSAA